MSFETLGEFLESHVDAIEGCISYLASKNDRPSGYPFNTITIYCIEPWNNLLENILLFNPKYCEFQGTNIVVKPASDLNDMRVINFKKAGPIAKGNVQELKPLLAQKKYIMVGEDYHFENGIVLPPDCVTCKTTIPVTDETHRKTTGNGLYLVEVDDSPSEDHWLAISFKKMVKEYLTETLKLNITDPIFGGPGNPVLLAEERDAEVYDLVTRVSLNVVNCTEKLYQSLEQFGDGEFCKTPINCILMGRQWCYNNKDVEGQVKLPFDGKEVSVLLKVEYAFSEERRKELKEEFLKKLKEFKENL